MSDMTDAGNHLDKKLDKLVQTEMEPESNSEGGNRSDRHLVMRCFSLFVSFAAACTAFGAFAFVNFTDDVHTFFHLTQEEADWVISINWLGLVCAFPVALLAERCGNRAGAGVALLVPFVACILLWSATTHSSFYQDHEALALFYFFLAGAGGGITYMMAVIAAIPLFSSHNRGAAVALVTSGSSVGPLVYMIVYDTVFSGGEGAPGGLLQSLGGYFIFMAIVFAIINLLGLAFYDCYSAPELREPEELQLIRHDTPHSDYNAGTSTENQGERRVRDCDRTAPMSFCELFGTVSVQYIVWSAAIMVGLVVMNYNNLSVFMRSGNIVDSYDTLAYVAAIMGVVGKMTVGFISDRVRYRFPRAGFLMISGAVNVWLFLLAIFWITDLAMLVLHCICVTLSAIVAFALTPTILVEEFGIKSFPRIWGLFTVACGLCGFVFNNILGVLYEVYVDPGTDVCTGSQCFRWTFLIAAGLQAVAVVFLVLFIRKGNTPYRNTQAASS